MRGLARRIASVALVALMALQAPAEAATYYYYRGGAQAGQQTGSPPASPAAPGVFAILVDGPDPDVAIKGQSYSATTYAYSNVGQVVFAVQAGSLPAGLSINSTTGTISGMPTTVGSASFTIQGVDTANGRLATDARTLDTVDAFSITATPATSVIAGNAYSATFALAGGSQPYSFAATGLPGGLSLTSGATSATLSGAASATGSYQIAVTGTEAHGLAITYPFTLNVVSPLAIVGLPPGTGTVGIPYSGQVQVSGGLAPYSFSLGTGSGSLPNGVTLKPTTGVVSGTPTTAGTKSGIKIKVTDASGQTFTSSAFSIAIAVGGNQALAINAAPVATATESQIYSSQWFAGGGTTPYVYSLAPGSGPLPAGLTLNGPTGIISGSPPLGSAGTYPNIIVQVTDALGAVAVSGAYTLTVLPNHPLAISGNPGNGQVAIPYAYQFNAVGGSETGYVYTLGTGTLPPGLNVQQNGLLTGVPTLAGTYSFKVRVTDSASATALTSTMTIIVAPTPPLVISGNPPATGTVGQAYNAVWSAFDGSGTGYHFTSVGAPLPPGLSLSDVLSQGKLTGSPTIAGTYPGLQIKVTDSLGQTATSSVFSIAVSNPAVQISGNPPASASLGLPYSAQFSATGGTGTGYVYSLVSGTLPPGLTLDSSTGAISGSPTNVGTYTALVVKVADGAGNSAFSNGFSIAVSDPNPLTVSWSPQTSWDVGGFMSLAVTATGGDPANYVWSFSGGLPTGTAQNASTGGISGILTAAGTFGPVTVHVTDGLRSAVTAPATFSVTYPALVVAGNPAATASVGQTYSAQFTATGGSGAGYVYSLVSGTLPAGLTLDPSTGAISGAPTVTGTYPGLSVKAVDGANNSGTSQTFQIVVTGGLSISGTPDASTVKGADYFAQFTATGGSGGGYVYSLSGGTLPDGLTLSSSGMITGVSTTEGASSGITVQVADSAGHVAVSQPFSITVTAAQPQTPLSIAWGGNPPNTTFSEGDWMITPVVVTGGSGNFSYSFTGSCGETFDGYGCGLPDNVWQNQDPDAGTLAGALMGGMSPAGSYGPFTVTVHDNDTGQSAITTPLVFLVSPPYVPAITVAGPYVPGSSDTSTPPDSPIGGTPFQAQIGASGGNGGPYAYTFSVGSSALPPGLTMDPATGLISGTIDSLASGWYGQYQVIATDATNNFGLSQWFGFFVREGLGVDQAEDQRGQEGKAFSSFYQAADGTNYFNGAPGAFGGDNTYQYTLVGTLPSGLSYSVADGSVTGTPAVGTAGVYPGLYYVVIDGTGATVTSNTFSLIVDAQAPLTVTTSYGGAKYYPGDFLSFSLSAQGGDGGPYAYALTTVEAGALPPGLSFGGNSLSGTISAATIRPSGFWTFVATATDNHGHSASTTFQVPMDFMLLQINGINSITADPGQTISPATFFTYYGAGGNVFTVASGSLPPGLTLSTDGAGNGVLSGTVDPGATGLYGNIVVRVTDSFGHTADAGPFDVFVTPPAPDLALAGDPPTHVYPGFYQTRFYASGGSGSYSFAITRQPNDQGPFQINASSGVVQAALSEGVYPDIEVTVTDSNNPSETRSQQWTVTVGPALRLAVPTPITGKVGTPITPVQAQATGGSGTGYQFSMNDFSRALPAGLTLDRTTGIISGTPTDESDWSLYRAQVTDSAGNFASSNQFTVTIGRDLKLTGTPQADAYVGEDYLATKPTVSGGSNQPWIYTYALVSGTLPPGLTLPSSGGNRGKISGSPTTVGTYSGLRIQVTDPSTGATALSDTFSITVHPSRTKHPVVAWFQTPGFAGGYPLGTLGTNLPVQTINAAVNVTTQVQAAAAGGSAGQYTWSITPGYGSENMSLSSTGKVTVTYLKKGTYSLSLRATDPVSGIYGDTRPLTVYVSDLVVKVGNDVTVFDGENVDIPIQIEGGTGPYTVVKGGGMLPTGVGISSSSVSGSPQGQGGSGGVYQFSVFATDANGLTADSGVITIGVKHRGQCLYLGAGPYGVVNQGAVDAGSGVRPDYDGLLATFVYFTTPGGYYSVDVNSSSVGRKSFDYLAWGDYPQTPQYSQYRCDRLGFSVDFVQQVMLMPPASQLGTAGGSFVTKLNAVGGKRDGGYWYTAQGLPAGLNIDNRTGDITGVISPTAAGLYQVTVSAMDAYGLTDQTTMQMAVQPGS